MRSLLLLALLTIRLSAQSFSVPHPATGAYPIDLSGASQAILTPKGPAASRPATCTIGAEYFATDALAGQNKYFCTATNTWTQQLAGGSGGGATYTQSGTGATANRTLQNKASEIVSVEDFGAVSDDSTDSTSAINAAIGALHTGQTLYFPCSASAARYKTTSVIHFDGLTKANIRGGGNGCYLNYNPPSGGSGAIPGAFTFIGSFQLTIDHLGFFASNSTNFPQAVMVLGRASGTTFGGAYNFDNVSVDGYASKALVYSIASEENHWSNMSATLNGGGALYVFYTSTSDDLSVASLPTASNLSMWLDKFHMADFSSTITSSHVIITDVGLASSVGDHSFRDGYLSSGFSASAGVGFMFKGLDTGTNAETHFRNTVDNIRFENGGTFIRLSAASGVKIGSLNLTNNTIATSTSGAKFVLADTGVIMYQSVLVNNNAYDGETGSLDGVLNSYISESYPITFSSMSGTTYINTGSGGTKQYNSLALYPQFNGADPQLDGYGGAWFKINSNSSLTTWIGAGTGDTWFGDYPGKLIVNHSGIVSFNGAQSTGSTAGALGSNCPATSCSAPYTWIQVKTSDGSTAYMPVWK